MAYSRTIRSIAVGTTILSLAGAIVLAVAAVKAGAAPEAAKQGPESKPEKAKEATPEEIDVFLLDELKRLRAAPKSEQADVADIQAKLTDKTTLDEFNKLIEAQHEKMVVDAGARLKKEHPWLYAYGEKHPAPAEAIAAGAELNKISEQIRESLGADARIMRVRDELLDPTDEPRHPEPEDRRHFLEKSTVVGSHMEAIARAANPAWIPKDANDFELDLDGGFAGHSLFMFAAARIKALELDGKIADASELLTRTLNVLSRCEARGLLISLLILEVDRSPLLRCAIALAGLAGVPPETVDGWLKDGLSVRLDVVEAMAWEAARFVRVHGNNAKTRAHYVKDTTSMLTLECGLTSVDDWMRWLKKGFDGVFRLFEYAARKPGDVRTLAQFKDANKAMSGLRFGYEPNVYDAYINHLEWAGLELKILERKVGALKEHKEQVAEVLKKYDGLRVEWKDKKLELWPISEIRPRGPWPMVIAIDLKR